MRRVGDQRAGRVEQGAGEIEPLLDVDRRCGRLERDPHFLGDRHEEVVEDFKSDRVDFGPGGGRDRAPRRAFEDQRAVVSAARGPAVVDHRGRAGIDHQCGTGDALVDGQVGAVVAVPRADPHRRRPGARRDRDGFGLVTRPARFDDQRIDHQRGVFGIITETRAVEGEEGSAHLGERGDIDLDRRVAPRSAQSRAAIEDDAVGGESLRTEDRPRLLGQYRQRVVEHRPERSQPAALAQDLRLGKADAKRRQQTGEWMNKDPLDPEQVGDGTRVLAARPAEAGERIARHIVPARDRDFADRVGHIVVGDGEETACDLGGRAALPGRGLNRIGDPLDLCQRCALVERLVAPRPKQRREMRRRNPPEHEIAIGHRQWPAIAIAGRPRLRPRALGPDSKAHPVEAADRSAPRRHGMDLHHRRADAHPRDHALFGQFEPPAVMRDVGRGAAHVEPDQPFLADCFARRDHPDHAPGGPRQDRIFAAKRRGVGQPAVRLHELERHARSQRARDLGDIAGEDRRQIGVGDRRIAARDQLDQRGDVVARGNLGEAEHARDFGQFLLVRRKCPAVH